MKDDCAVTKKVGAQFMSGLLDANLCKNKQINNNITMLLRGLGTMDIII